MCGTTWTGVPDGVWTKRGPQRRVFLEQRPACLAQARDVQGSRELEDQLDVVHVRRVAVVAGVEEQPFLQRRQRQHVGQSTAAAPPVLQALQFGLADDGGDDVGGGESPVAGLRGVGDQRAQRGEPQIGQLADLARVNSRPGHVQEAHRCGPSGRSSVTATISRACGIASPAPVAGPVASDSAAGCQSSSPAAGNRPR